MLVPNNKEYMLDYPNKYIIREGPTLNMVEKYLPLRKKGKKIKQINRLKNKKSLTIIIINLEN